MTHDEGATGRVGYFRRPEPEYAGDRVHEQCGRTWHDHLWIDSGAEGETLCPGGPWQIGDEMQFLDGAWHPFTPAGKQPVAGCACGDPQERGLVHRTDGPCYMDEQAPQPAIMRYFDFTHLTNPRLQAVSAEFAQLAQYVADYLPRGEERDVALRKLLEAKDAAVRATLEGMPNRGLRPAEGRQVLGVLREPRAGEVCCGGGPVAAAGEPVFREGSAGACCRDEQPAGAGEEGPDHG